MFLNQMLMIFINFVKKMLISLSRSINTCNPGRKKKKFLIHFSCKFAENLRMFHWWYKNFSIIKPFIICCNISAVAVCRRLKIPMKAPFFMLYNNDLKFQNFTNFRSKVGVQPIISNILSFFCLRISIDFMGSLGQFKPSDFSQMKFSMNRFSQSQQEL